MKLCFAFACALPGLLAQDAPPRPAFEVASVKECRNVNPPPPSTSSPGRVGLSCWNLRRLITDAYDLFATGKVDPLNSLVSIALEGAPAWLNSAQFTIDARAGTPQTQVMMGGPMMQVLLEERFHLKLHRQTREVPAYIMTVAKSGLKMPLTAQGACTPFDPTDLELFSRPVHDSKPLCLTPTVAQKGPLKVLDAHGITMQVFARLLHPDGRPVIDRTGLTGAYDMHLEWGDDPPPASSGAATDPSPHASAIAATREQLGLRLDPGKGPVEFLVIDHIERPTGN